MKKLGIMLGLLLLMFLVGCDKSTTAVDLTTERSLGAIELRVYQDKLQWRYETESSWTTLLDLDTLIGEAGINGVDGKNTEFQTAAGYIQWRLVGTSTWNNLIALDTLKGEIGKGVSEVVINEQGEMVVFYDDETENNLGMLFVPHLVQFKDMFGNIVGVDLVLDGMDATPPAPTEITGYDFVSWVGNYTNVKNDLVITGNYQPEVYQLTFMAMGGEEVAGYTVAYGQSLLLGATSRPGYKFVGWFSGPNASDPQIYNGQTITSDLVLYARWQKTSAMDVGSEEALHEALNDITIDEINIICDFSLTDYIEILRPLTINGNGHFLTVLYNYELFYISGDYYGSYAENNYPNGGYLKVYDLTFDVQAIGYEPVYSIFELGSVEDFDLYLYNVNITGRVYEAVRLSDVYGVNLRIVDCNFDTYYSGLSMSSSESIQAYIYNSEFKGINNLYLANLYSASIIVRNSSFVTLDTGHDETCVNFLNIGLNTVQVNFFDSFVDTLSLEPAKVMITYMQDGQIEYMYENTTINMNYPVYEEVFLEESADPNYSFYNSTFVLKEGITDIPDYGFQDQESISEIILPSTLKTIGEMAFDNCYNLTNIIIPDGVSSIGYRAFSGCDYVSSVYIPNTVTYIGEQAFYGISSDATIYIQSGTDMSLWDIDWNYSDIEGVEATGTLNIDGVNYVLMPDLTANIIGYSNIGVKNLVVPQYVYLTETAYEVTRISPYAFYREYTLLSIFLPESIKSIEIEAFYECISLKVVDFGNNPTLESIGYQAFAYCRELRSIIIPATVIELDRYIFYQCYKLETAIFAEKIQITSIPDGMFTYCENLREIVIPATVIVIETEAFSGNYKLSTITFAPGSQIEYIGDFAFSGNSSLISFTLPDTVTTIGMYAFSYNTKLISFNFGENSQLTTLGQNVFSDNSSMVNIVLPETVTSIGAALFYNCISLETFTFPANVTSIPNNMFYNCLELVSVYFSETSAITAVGSLAFMYCDSLADITLPDTVTTIGYNAFFQCNSLVEMYLPSSLIKIDNYGFYDCDLLTNIIYGDPYSLEYIGSYAFSLCPELDELFIADTVTYVGVRAFDNTHNVILNIEATSKPTGWADDWNVNGATIVNWGVNHRTITVVLDNGESDILIYEKIGTALIAPSDPVKVGYDFTGWFTYDGASYTPYSFTTMPEEDLTVYAQYMVTP